MRSSSSSRQVVAMSEALMKPVILRFQNGSKATYWVDTMSLGEYMEDGLVVETQRYNRHSMEKQDEYEFVNFGKVIRAKPIEDDDDE